jgi:hypothetical protein
MIQRSRSSGHHVFYPRAFKPGNGNGLFLTIEAIRQIRAAAGDDDGTREPGGWVP